MGGEEETKVVTHCSEHLGPGRARFEGGLKQGGGKMEGRRRKEREADAQGLTYGGSIRRVLSGEVHSQVVFEEMAGWVVKRKQR